MWDKIFNKDLLQKAGMAVITILVLVGSFIIITNHIDHTNEVILEQATSNEKLMAAIHELINYLKRQ